MPDLEICLMETILDMDKYRSRCHPSRKPGSYYSSLCAEHKSLLLRTMCPGGKRRMLCEKRLACSWGSMVKESCWCPEMCASALRQPLAWGSDPCERVSVQCQEAAVGKHLGKTQYSLLCHQLHKLLCFNHPLVLLALHQPQLCSPLKNKRLWSLSTALGFQKHKEYPRSSSRAPQVWLDLQLAPPTEPKSWWNQCAFYVEEWLKRAFGPA